MRNPCSESSIMAVVQNYLPVELVTLEYDIWIGDMTSTTTNRKPFDLFMIQEYGDP